MASGHGQGQGPSHWTSTTGTNRLQQQPRETRAGIVGIERKIQKDAARTQGHISEAFNDLKSLMDNAKPMVDLVKKISKAIQDKQGTITDDETVQFRQQLLSIGIKDPVTKAKFGSGNKYYEGLAREISRILADGIKDYGGLMNIVEAFCRVNRARGMELASPEDLLHGCEMLERLGLPIRLKKIGDKVFVLEHVSFNQDHCVKQVVDKVNAHGSLTQAEYAAVSGAPYVLAKHSLVLTEERGLICRDESIEGLKFYPIEPLKEPYDLQL